MKVISMDEPVCPLSDRRRGPPVSPPHPSESHPGAARAPVRVAGAPGGAFTGMIIKI